MKNEKKYDIGLDIGVGSVGWCVTDENNNIIKHNGKNMWGSRIFDEASTAKERRTFRTAKRRLNRRKERINILQSLMIDDMEKEYPNFFQILRETANNYEEKTISESILGIKYNFFSEINMTDCSYYKKFPTIYHLRNYLINTNKEVDIRLVYLAIHHIIKYRGNFLYDGNFSENSNEINKKLEEILEFLNENYNISLNCENKIIFEILSQKNISKANKKDRIIQYFIFDKNDKQIVINIINAFLGYTFDISKIFDISIEKSKISFSSDIENEEEIKEILQENDNIYDAIHTIYSWYILQDILKGNSYISEAFIAKYNKYESDLKLLKKIYKDYFPDEYSSMFRKKGKDNYVAYNGKTSGKLCKKCKSEEFFNTLKKKINTLPDECKEKEIINNNLDDNNFLKKLNVTDNGAIPHQLHEKELIKILDNQSKYYKTLEKNKNKIIQLFSFKIPYYVGPLSKNKEQSKWSWVIRENDVPIRPWNFNDVVNEDATAEEFIKRMTNKCTYLLGENVIPKQSLLYSEFCVLNELNNIRIEEKSLAKDTKEKIIENLFKKHKKVTAKMLSDYLRIEGLPYSNIIGLTDNNNFNSNMSSYIDLVNILGKVDESNYEECENLIYWITIFEDKKILKRKIVKEYGKESKVNKLNDQQVEKLVKLRYIGWSRLSKKLINGLKSKDGSTIIEKLRNTPMNFMKIINEEKFGFNEQINKMMPKKNDKVEYADIEEIPTSPANKRAIWQSICVIKEIKKIMKSEPKNIYIEFARDEDKNKKMKDNRAKKLLKIYDNLDEQLKYLKDNENSVYKELKQHQSDKTLTEKMYLYFIQNGKCLYSGKSLNIDELSNYEVDHILPQSYIKDDSIDNKALVIREMNQRKKDSLLLADEIINERRKWWQWLLDSGLISETKFYRLTRNKMFETDIDREKFVNRQLVETRQITKHVTNLLVNMYKETDIYALRAELTHGFRMKYKIYKNRNVNNYHHAQDAYILNIIGNIINHYWKETGEYKYSEYVKKYVNDEKTKTEKYGMMMGFINKYVDINKVKKVMNYKDCFISRMLLEETGAFYNQTLYSPNDEKNNPVIPLKENKDVNKYGGYSGENKAYFIVFKYTSEKGEEEYQLVGIPVQVAYKIKQKSETLENYIKNNYLNKKNYKNLRIIKTKILKNQEYLDENGELMRFCSDTEIRPSKELIVSDKISELIYLMNMDENKLDDEEKKKVENSYDEMFDYLLEKIKKEYKVFFSIYIKIKEVEGKFKKINNEEKKSIINGLINLMETGQGNLKVIGLTEREGRMAGKTFKTEKLNNIIFVDKSTTGIYERRYKINGMENSCNK